MTKGYVQPPNRVYANGILDYAITYLAGPMEFASDGGVIWRQDFINLCYEQDIYLRFLDPTNKLQGMSITEEIKAGKALKDAEDWEGLKQHVKSFRREDLRCVDYCDFLTVMIDKDIHMCGTYDELFTAERQKKPILAIVNGGKKSCPGWLFDVIDHELMFDNVSSCVEYLNNVNSGHIKLDSRWVLIRQSLEKIYTDKEQTVGTS